MGEKKNNQNAEEETDLFTFNAISSLWSLTCKVLPFRCRIRKKKREKKEEEREEENDG